MHKRVYKDWNPEATALAIIHRANQILADYARQGYTLTLRQLYYQFVATNSFPDDRKWSWTGTKYVRDSNGTKNAQPNYKWLGSIVDKARGAGLLDWEAMVDRTRKLEQLAHWADPAEAMASLAAQYRFDLWRDQPTRVEVWVEKDALSAVVERTAERYDCAWFACKGYVSQPAMWEAAQRFKRYAQQGQNVVILHLGDHDPSGIDMTRDIRDRLENFTETDWLYDEMDVTTASVLDIREAMTDHMAGVYPALVMDEDADDAWNPVTTTAPLTIERIALNMDQVEQYDPPSDPAKLTDSRASGYIEQFGDESWELDALTPTVVSDLIVDGIERHMDEDRMDAAREELRQSRRSLTRISANFDEVDEYASQSWD